MRSKLKTWFWCASFTGEYESSSATLAERDAPALKNWLTGGDEPEVVRAFEWNPERWGRTVTTRQQGLYRATMALTLQQRPRDFHTGAPLSVSSSKQAGSMTITCSREGTSGVQEKGMRSIPS